MSLSSRTQLTFNMITIWLIIISFCLFDFVRVPFDVCINLLISTNILKLSMYIPT